MRTAANDEWQGRHARQTSISAVFQEDKAVDKKWSRICSDRIFVHEFAALIGLQIVSRPSFLQVQYITSHGHAGTRIGRMTARMTARFVRIDGQENGNATELSASIVMTGR